MNIRFTCPNCGGHDVSVDINYQPRYGVYFSYDELTYEMESDDSVIIDALQEDGGIWYCSDCMDKIYTGTEEGFINYMIKNNGAYEDSLAVIADYIKSIIPTDKIINIDCVGTSLRLDMSDKKAYYISIGETPQ